MRNSSCCGLLVASPFFITRWCNTPARFFFLSAERVDITANNFVNIDPAAANVLRAAGFPVELGNVAYDFKTTELLAKLDHQWAPNHSFSLRANFADTTNENLEPFGGIVARSRGAVQLRKDWAVAAAQTDILSPRWVNEARVQFAHQHQEINSLDPNCGGSCLTDEQGGPTLEVTGAGTPTRKIDNNARNLTAHDALTFDVQSGHSYDVTKFVGIDTALTSPTPQHRLAVAIRKGAGAPLRIVYQETVPLRGGQGPL